MPEGKVPVQETKFLLQACTVTAGILAKREIIYQFPTFLCCTGRFKRFGAFFSQCNQEKVF